MNNNKLIDVELIVKKYEYHLKEAERLKLLIESLQEFTIKDQTSSSKKEKSKIQQAIAICEEVLQKGEIINSSKKFKEILDSRNIILSKQSVSAALKQSKKITFDKENKLWTLLE